MPKSRRKLGVIIGKYADGGQVMEEILYPAEFFEEEDDFRTFG